MARGWGTIKKKLNLWICIFIFGTLVCEKDNGDSGPTMCIQPRSIQRHKFSAEALSGMAWREAQAPLSVRESGRQEVVPRNPVPTAIPMNSHNSTGPLAGYLFSNAPPCSPWTRSWKEEKGGRGVKLETSEKIIIFPLLSQHDPDNSRLPFSVGQNCLCVRSHEGAKRNKKPNEKGVHQRLIHYKPDQSVPPLRNRRKSISFLFPSFLFYVWP